MHYVEKVREYNNTMDIKTAVETAVNECIKEGVLTEFFKRYKDMIISSDPIDGTIERREYFARQEGMEAGMQAGIRAIIEGALRNGKSPESIAEFINLPLKEVLKVQNEMMVEA